MQGDGGGVMAIKGQPTGKTRHRRSTKTKVADFRDLPKYKDFPTYMKLAGEMTEYQLVILYEQVFGQPVPVDGKEDLGKLPLHMLKFSIPITNWKEWLLRCIAIKYAMNFPDEDKQSGYRVGQLEFLHNHAPLASMLGEHSSNYLLQKGNRNMKTATRINGETTTTTTTTTTPAQTNGNVKAAKTSRKAAAKDTPKTTKATKEKKVATTKAKAAATKTATTKKTESAEKSINRQDDAMLAKQRIIAIKGASDNVPRGWSGDLFERLCKAGAKGWSREEVLKELTSIVKEREAKREPEQLLRETFLVWPRKGFAKVSMTGK